MYLSKTLLALSCSPAFAINIILSNDDGWAETNIRQFYNALTDAGDSVVISAPAENQSGKGSMDAPATKRTSPCEFDSCPAGSPATGNNASMPRFNYVNSFPVTAMRTGIQTTSPQFFSGQKPDLALAGPNVGANLGLEVNFSGTVGAATEAVKEGIPGIAFSGATGKQTAWSVDPPPMEASVYADLANNVTQTLVGSGKPYLPANVWLNINLPKTGGACGEGAGRYQFVLSRIFPAAPLISGKDVVTCGNGARLPTENAVVGTDGCYASISVGHADTKLDATAAEQAVLLAKLGGILSCLPSSSVSVA